MQDDTLLSHYARDGSEAAFGQIIARHLTLVYSTCLREIGSPALAEDAAQVVFLLLARKAKTLRAGPSLAGWLYQTARFVAKDVCKQEARRQRREQAVMQQMMHEQASPDPLWDTIEPLLNRALSSLKPTEREAVLLRFLEGHSLAETGAALGLSEDAARMRVTRAVEKLRRYLAAHGAVVSGASLTGLLASEAARPIPAHAASLTQGTLQALSVGPSANVLLLSKGVYQSMKLVRMKVAALASALLLGGVALVPFARALNSHKTRVQALAGPAVLIENVPTKFSLDKGQHTSYRVTLPKGASTIILDMRQTDGKAANINCRLSFADISAAQIPGSTRPQAREMFVNSTQLESRVTAQARLEKPKMLVLDIHNQGGQCQNWLTVFHAKSAVNTSDAEASSSFAVPLFGNTIPTLMALSETKTGRLEQNGFSYFLIFLKAGHYQTLLDFKTVSGKPTDLRGSLSLSDEKGLLLFNEGRAWPTGGNDITLNEDFSRPDRSTFTLKQSGIFLVQVTAQNSKPSTAFPVNFTAQILPNDAILPAKQN